MFVPVVELSAGGVRVSLDQAARVGCANNNFLMNLLQACWAAATRGAKCSNMSQAINVGDLGWSQQDTELA